MDRRKQLSNVAFGGDWAEAIVYREEAQLALSSLEKAISVCIYEDVRTPAVLDALKTISKFKNGSLLQQAFLKAAAIQNSGVREQELNRILVSIRSSVGRAVE